MVSTAPNEQASTGAAEDAPSVEDFVANAAAKMPARANKVNGKSVEALPEPREVASIDKFRRVLHDAAAPRQFTVHPGTEQELTVLVRGLSLRERDEARALATEVGPSGTERTNGFMLECAYIAVGMVEPHFEMADIAEMSEGVLDPIYYEIVRLTQLRESDNAKGASQNAPLPQTSIFERILPRVSGGTGPR